MKVFRVRPDVHAWGYLVPVTGESATGEDLVFDGKSRAWSWRPLHVGMRPAGKDAPDFARFGHGGLVLSPRAYKLCGPVLERCGELLPVHLDHKEVYLFHATRLVDALDEAACEWIEVQGRRVHVRRYALTPAVYEAANVFKLPQMARDKTFTVEGRAPRPLEFKPLVEGAGLTGLVFEEVWAGPAPCPEDASAS